MLVEFTGPHPFPVCLSGQINGCFRQLTYDDINRARGHAKAASSSIPSIYFITLMHPYKYLSGRLEGSFGLRAGTLRKKKAQSNLNHIRVGGRGVFINCSFTCRPAARSPEAFGAYMAEHTHTHTGTGAAQPRHSAFSSVGLLMDKFICFECKQSGSGKYFTNARVCKHAQPDKSAIWGAKCGVKRQPGGIIHRGGRHQQISEIQSELHYIPRCACVRALLAPTSAFKRRAVDCLCFMARCVR